MSIEAHPVTHIQVENVSVADYAQYITHATPVHVMTDGVPEGATMTFIEHTVLDANQVLEPHQTIEVYQAIQQGVLEQVVLEQPIIAQISNGAADVQSDIKPPVGKGPFNCELCDKIFKKWNQLQRHMKSHDEDKPFRCLQCPVSFNMEDNLILHQATHVAENGVPTCPECNKKFSRVASLKAHIMMHEKEENLMCPECGDEFSVQSQLDRHMQEHREEHEGARRHACRQCNQDFSKLSLLREHMKQHYKIKASLSHRTYKRNIDRSSFHHKCKHCTKTFQKPSQLLRHERIHTGERPFKCKICNKAFNQKGALQIHTSKHTGEKPHMCEFCPMTFAQKGNLRAHIQRVHNIAKDGSRPTFECEECSCVFKKLGSLNAHISRAHSDTSDLPTQVEVRRVGAEEAKSLNETVIQQLLELSDQAAVMDGTDDEQVQDQDIRQKQVLDQDQAALAAGGASDILQQALENSGLTNGQPASVVTSMASSIINPAISTITVHDSSTGSIKKHVIRKVNGVRWHQCTYCSKEFKKPSDLVRHIRIHTHEKPYKCTQCFRAFAVKSTLTAHIKTHSGIKDYVCNVCNKLFSTQGSLKVHVRLHTGAKPFDCPHCDKKFRTSAHRKSHIHSHFRDNPDRRPRSRSLRRARQDVSLPEIPLQEPILITDTGLIQQPPRNNNVFNQYLGESGSVDRPYKCHYCRRCFKKSSHLKQHIRSHTGEKPYRCNTCFRSFVSSGVLKAHSRTHSGVKAYKCLICDTTFTTNGSLKRHMSTHSEVRPFMCPYCQKTFKTSVNCKKHMKTHRHELALQALQNEEQTVTEGETQCVGDTVVNTDDLTQPQTTADLSALQQDDIGHTTTITQQEFVPVTSISQDPGAVLSQATLQDLTGTVIDHQLQQTLSQQVFGQQQNFGQAFLNGQQGFGQLGQTVTTSLNSLGGQLTNQLTTPLGTQVTNTLNSQLSGQMTSLTSNQLMMQPQTLSNQMEIQQVSTAFSVATPSMSTTMPSTSMQNILETREVEDATEDQLVEETDEGEVIIGQDEQSDGKRLYMCEVCDKSFKKSSHLKQHVRSHTGEKPFKCPECHRMFVSTGVLKAHMKTHLGIKDYKCHICQATFTTNGSLTRHMMIHSSLRPFRCPFCNETFRTAVHCKRHMRVHRDGSGAVPPDSVPGDEESQAPAARRTKASIQITDDHTEELSKNPEDALSVSEKILLESASEKDRVSEQEKPIPPMHHCKHPHQCNHCPKSFKKPSDLMRHIRIHTGEKPFHCDKCGRSFTVKSTLDSHMKTHGPAQGDKKFKCHVCSSLFSTKGSLKVHMRLHTGAKPFKCPHCPGRFRTSGHRKSHILSHFKQDLPKKRKVSRSVDTSQNFPVTMVSSSEVPVQAGVPHQAMSSQVVSVDPSLLQTQSIVPISFTVPENLTSLNESQLATQVLQGLEGIQLHFTSGLGQGIQIAGLDPNILSQTVQIDASLLQQLQQQGNINITINPNVITQQVQAQDPNVITQTVQATDQGLLTQTVQADGTVLQQADPNIITQTVHDPNLMQNIQIQPVSSLQDTVNPNVIVQPMSSVAVTQVDAQQSLQTQNITLQARPDMAGFVVPDHMDVQVSEVSQMVVDQDQSLLSDNNDDDDDDDDDDYNDDDEEVPLDDHNSTIVHDEDTSLDFPQAMPIHDEKYSLQRNHICGVCHKAFKRSSHLKEHLTTHAPGSIPKKVKPTPHRCQTCDKAFQKPSQLMRHERIHTGERPYVCHLCEKAFNQKNALQVHLKKHSGERPHLCNYCSLSFTQKGNLKTHIKRAHHLEMVQSMNLPHSFVPAATSTISITSAPPNTGDDEGLDLSEVVDLFQQ
ncbi:zinc finger protein 236-like isoform X1 [Haliotis asinina]|uniref:zinc finger protein 236-like isoform X1 n=1 Tax=Haliotis asinina TaxID=109174 RepID=UPI0035326295